MLLSRRQTILLNLCFRQTNVIIILISLPESDMMDTVHLTVGPLTREAAKATVTQHLSLLKLISALHEMFKFGLRFQMWEG